MAAEAEEEAAFLLTAAVKNDADVDADNTNDIERADRKGNDTDYDDDDCCLARSYRLHIDRQRRRRGDRASVPDGDDDALDDADEDDGGGRAMTSMTWTRPMRASRVTIAAS